jgi:hypothetical protein
MPNMALIDGSWFWLIARRRAKAAGRDVQKRRANDATMSTILALLEEVFIRITPSKFRRSHFAGPSHLKFFARSPWLCFRKFLLLPRRFVSPLGGRIGFAAGGT